MNKDKYQAINKDKYLGIFCKYQFIVFDKYGGLFEMQMDHKRGIGNSL
jgi:hypothetical protein